MNYRKATSVSSVIVKAGAIAILFCMPFWAWADQLVGRVVKVSDGDTITILDSYHQQHKIRLSGIDAPEKRQGFGQQSKLTLSNLVAGKTVRVEWYKRDRYQRVVGKVLVDGIDANLNQINQGMAWHYKAYEEEQEIDDRSKYAQAEYEAKRYQRGLWRDKDPIAPWDFRHRKKTRSEVLKPIPNIPLLTK